MTAPLTASGTGTAGVDARTAVVVGGASGLGAAICHRLAAEGAHVVVADLNEVGAQRVADEISRVGHPARAHGVDVRHDASVAELFTAIDQHLAAPLGVLVLSAAVEVRKPLLDMSDEEWNDVVDTNLSGAFSCLRFAVPRMVDAGGGSIVALGSTLGQIVAPQYSAYCASKFALSNLVKQTAIEHAADGIRANVIAPGACDTGLFMRVAESQPDPEVIKRMVTTNVPMHRLGTAEEVCDAVVFLASEHSSFISGAVLPLDGALAARRT